MLKIIFLAVTLSIALSGSLLLASPVQSPLSSAVDVIVLENSEDFKKLIHNTELTQFTSVTNGTQSKSLLSKFTLGRRKDGDMLVAFDEDYFECVVPADLLIRIRYPDEAEQDDVDLTYIKINIDNLSPESKVFLIAGGPGQNYIDIGIVVSQETYFKYKIEIYGRY